MRAEHPRVAPYSRRIDWMSDLTTPNQPSIVRDRVNSIDVIRAQRDSFDELYISAAPACVSGDSACMETEQLYGKVADLLSESGATVVQERPFGALTAKPIIDSARAVAIEGCSAFSGVAPTFLEGIPCTGNGLSGVHMLAIVPHADTKLTEISLGDDAVGHLIETPDIRAIYLGAMAGTAADAALPETDQTTRMFQKTNAILEEHGFVYRDVVRTWIYVGEILDWYDEFNLARNAEYRKYGLLGAGDDFMPASTGIQARSPGEIALTMDVLAVQATPGGEEPTIGVLHNPLQNEAHAYGSAFARAMEVVTGGMRAVYISGTASIDETGATVYLDDIDKQIARTVENIEALIGTRGLTLDDLTQACVFIKHAEHIDRYLEICKGTMLTEIGVPMKADVCRADLLFEIDGVAAKAVDA